MGTSPSPMGISPPWAPKFVPGAPLAPHERPRDVPREDKSAQWRAKSHRDRPKSGQEPQVAGQDCPKTAQDRPQTAQDRPKTAQDPPKTAQDRPKTASSRFLSLHFGIKLKFHETIVKRLPKSKKWR